MEMFDCLCVFRPDEITAKILYQETVFILDLKYNLLEFLLNLPSVIFFTENEIKSHTFNFQQV